MINRERLLEFCQKKGIWVPNKSASLKELQTIIARWAMHEQTIERKNCFGLLDTEDNNCLSCDYRKACFKLSFGVEEEKYWKRLEKADRPSLEFD